MDWRSLPPGRERRIAYDTFRRTLDRQVTFITRPHDIIPYIRIYSCEGLTLKNLLNKSKCDVAEKNFSTFCVICQETINNKEIYRTLVCTHQFHQNCIDTWFIDNTKCPLCKKELS